MSSAKKPEILAMEMRTMYEKLAKLRVKDYTDVVIVCKECEFYVHKCILMACSQYFNALFQSDMEEALSGRIVFDQWSPKIMEAVLNFVYLGSVDKVASVKQLLEVAGAANYLGLFSLVTYCCQQLLEALEKKNCVDIWLCVEKFGSEDEKTIVADFFLTNVEQIIRLEEFLGLPLPDLKLLLSAASNLAVCTDRLFDAVLRWINDNGTDAPFKELIECIDCSVLSKEYIKTLCTEEVRKGRSEMSLIIKDIVLMSDTDVDEYIPHLGRAFIPAHHCGKNKLLVFCSRGKENKVSYGDEYQEFDLEARKWLPPQRLPFIIHEGMAVCQWGLYLWFIGGDRDCEFSDVQYNIQYCPKTHMHTEHIDYDDTPVIKTFHSSLIPSNKKLYLIGGEMFVESQSCTAECNCRTEPTSRVYSYEPLRRKWNKVMEMNYSHGHPSAVISNGRTYVFNGGSNEDFIEYNDDMDTLPWTMVSILMPFFSIPTTIYCYPVARGKVYAFCEQNDASNVITMCYNPGINMWQCVKGDENQNLNDVVKVIASCSKENCLYYHVPNIVMPTMSWDPATKKHETLATPTEECALEYIRISLYTCGV